MDEDIQTQLSSLGAKEQKMILIQSLRFCQMRDGEIFQNAKIVEKGQLMVDQEQKEDESMGYNKYVIQASRFKPECIDSMATHKDLLKLYL